MLRKRTGSVVCPSCGRLVGVNEPRCPHCGRARPGMFGFLPLLKLGHDFGFTQLVIGGCVALYLIALLLSRGEIGMGGVFDMLAPSMEAQVRLGASGAVPVFGLGRWWTLLSAAWLHGSALHILFNMMWVRQLAPTVGATYGAARMVIIYTVASVAGFGLSSLVGAYLPFLPRGLGGALVTVGASAPIFGLLGALVLQGRRGGSSALGSQALTFAIVLGVFGFAMRTTDNWAHLGGFVGGWLAGHLLDPRVEEKVEHVIAAFACLGLVLASVVVSLVTSFSLRFQ